MKILCASDIHSETRTFFRFASKLKNEDYDCGILAGDLIDEYPTSKEAIDLGIANKADFKTDYNPNLTLEDLDKQINKVNNMFNNHDSILFKTLEKKRDLIYDNLENTGKPVFVILGNHDKIEWLTKKNIYNLHNEVTFFNGVKFMGYRYTLMEKNENEIEVDLKKLVSQIEGKYILVTHSPPYGILDKNKQGNNIGSKSLMSFVKRYKPILHIFGHVHEDFGVYKNFINASYFTNNKFISVKINL